MNRIVLAFLTPPLAVCRYGCAGCCAAPITVVWIAGIISIIYGFMGGPAQLESISWGTLGLGVAMWLLAAIWAGTVIRGVDADKADPRCSTNRSTVCRMVSAEDDDHDPMSDIKNLTH
jgi:hypothetical protein